MGRRLVCGPCEVEALIRGMLGAECRVLLLEHMLREVYESTRQVRKGIREVMRRVRDIAANCIFECSEKYQKVVLYHMLVRSDDPMIDIAVVRSCYALGDEITTVASGY